MSANPPNPSIFNLDRELKFYRVQQNAEPFRREVRDVYNAHFREWTVDGLMCEPAEAIRFCWLVRFQLRNPELPDRVIMKTLLNIRKNWDKKIRDERFGEGGN
jgi:hypothetical protein